MRCDHCQPLLLDYLYGLLDPAEASAVQAHLGNCADCTAAHGREARTSGLLARAARFDFPQVRFAAPADAVGTAVPVVASPLNNGSVAHPVVPSSLARPARPAAGRVWVRWAVAAGVLAMIPGALLPLSGLSKRYETAKREATGAAQQLAAARVNLEQADAAGRRDAADRYAAAKKQTEAVLAEWVAAEKAADQAAKAQDVAVSVTRPLSVQPGAPNDFAVSVQDKAGRLRGSRVEAEVRDAAGAVVFRQPLDAAKPGDAQPVRLPADVWAKVNPQADLFLAVTAVNEQTGARTDLQDQVRLFGPVYATMLVTDKASYRPGERLFFRSLTLDRVSFRPPAHEQVLHYSLRRQDGPAVPGAELYGTTGVVRVADGHAEPVLGPDGQPVRGVGTGAFALPSDLPDGDYTLTLTERPGRGGQPPAVLFPVTRTVKVRSGAPERLAKTLTFGPAVAPGQAVTAAAEVKFQGQPRAGAEVTATATADGKPVPFVRLVTPKTNAATKTTDAAGRVEVKFVLPQAKDLARGDVRLKVTFRTPEGEESVADRVPVAGREVAVEFFPEGGKLVAGVPNRVYVRATTPTGVGVGARGVVTAGADEVAKVESPADVAEAAASRGLGVFTFTPQTGTAYRLKFDGRDGPGFDLPRAEVDGVAMTVPDPVTHPGQPVRVRLYSAGKARNLLVGAYTRGRLADTQRIAAEPGEVAEVKLLAGNDPRGGVTRVTVFEQPDDAGAELIPVAERLVFRKPGELLNLTASANVPSAGGPTELSIAAKDEKGNPEAAILWAAAVNTAAAPGAKDRSLPTHFLLAGEIQTPDDLEHADFLLTDHPQAAAALDLVLATQGWRRFVEQAGPGTLAKQPANRRNLDAERLLVMNGAAPVGTESAPTREHRRLYEAYWPRYEAAVAELDAAHAAQAAEPPLKGLLAVYEDRRRETADLAAAVRDAADALVAARGRVNAAAGGLAVLAAVVGVVALVRPNGVRGVTPLAVAACGAGGLAVLLAVNAPDASFADGPAFAETPPLPSHSGTADPKRPDLVAPPLKASAGPNGVVVQAIPGGGKVEPFIVSSTQPPRTPSPVGVESTKLNPPFGAESRNTIPDDILKKGLRATSRDKRPTAPATDADRKALDAAAGYAVGRAMPLAVPIEEALPTRQADAADLPDDAADRIRAAVPWVPPLVVREYAAPRPGTADESAADTVLWQPLIVLPTDGRTTLSFFPGSAPGGYQVVVAGHTLDGRIGTVRTVLPAAPPAKDAPASPK